MYTKALSPSGIKLYKTCPRQWKDRYILGNKGPDRRQSDRGTDLHLELELFFTGAQPYPAANKVLRPWQRFMENLSVIKNTAEGEVAVRQDWSPCTFNDPEANYRGKYDLALDANPDVFDAFDWKSGKIYPDHEFQGLSYCAMDQKPRTKFRTHFVYLDIPTHVETREYAPDRISHERSTLDATIMFIRLDTEHRPTPGPSCNWCHLSWRKGGDCRAAR